MQHIRPLPRVFVVSLTALLVSCAAQDQGRRAGAGEGRLGSVEFPTTCSSKAQRHFLRGVAALHSFWYPVALDEFRAATRFDPGCMMGYWGEAMAHNHPIWGDPQETDAARKVIQRIQMTPELTPRERSYLRAVKLLYGEGDKAARDRAYAAAMERVHREYPDDVEAALFYALALMGAVGPEDPAALQTRLRAGQLASQVFKIKPNHPGAAHYVIHAYDDPTHARFALAAARRYAEIAPAAPHALHMPSHIFLQLGMWRETASSNEASWTASDNWVRENDLPIGERDYHSLHWLQYAYLQQGRYDDAEEMLRVMRGSVAGFAKDDMQNLMYGMYLEATMAASYLIATEQWDAAGRILGPVAVGGAKERTGAESNPSEALALIAQTPAIFARGLAAAMTGSAEAEKIAGMLRDIGRQKTKAPIPFVGQLREAAAIQALEITAALQAARGEFGGAIKTMEEAARSVDAMPPPAGPPLLIKPVHELFAEILLQADHPREAAEQFAISLQRHPNRARSLLGVARAFAQAGDVQRATRFYERFRQQWEDARSELPELGVARSYTKRALAR